MTTKVFEANSFNDFLSAQLEEHRQKDPRFSLRSFARNLGLSHSRLSEILSGQTISMTSAQAVCEVLQLRPAETTYLLDLVRASTARSEKIRLQAAARVELQKSQREFKPGQNGEFFLSKWYHAALIEFLTGTEMQYARIATALHISTLELESAIQNLQAEGFIRREDDHWVKVDGYLKFESSVPSQSVRDFHKASLVRATTALDQPIESRKFLTYVMTVRHEKLGEARQELENFAASFSKKYSDSETREGLVYSLGLQFFGY